MPNVERYAPGEFAWVDLMTPDIEAARAFYTGIFDWVAGEPSAEGGGYTQLHCRGRVVLGMMGMDEGMRAAGLPALWTSYVAVADADAAAERAVELGAKLELPPLDVFDFGRMVVLADPNGARLALWQPRTHIGATLRDEPESLCWNELWTRDAHAARAQEFYAGLFGWTFRSTAGGGHYVEIFSAGRANGGMLVMPAAAGLPTCWVPYFAVADCDAAEARIQAQGGAIQRSAQDIEGVGRFAVAADPQGGTFCVIALRTPGA